MSVTSPTPSDHPDLAELRHRAEVAEAAAALMAEQRDNALLRVETAEQERDEAKRRAAPIGGPTPAGRREAAKKLLCNICACSAETDPASLDLPHVVTDCLEPLETLIAERDACLYLAQEAHKYAGRDGRDIFDAIAEKHAALARATEAEATITRLQAQLAQAREALNIWLRAMETGRSEPLFIARDHTIALLEDLGASENAEGETNAP